MNIFTLFWHASLMVQGVMLTLLALSILSWALIIADLRQIQVCKSQVFAFFNDFWAASSIETLFANTNDDDSIASTIFREGFQISKETPNATTNIERRMRIIQDDALAHLGERLHWLATVSHISPYVGLLGTVCGIIHTFQALSVSQQATLSTVAPGIAEALVTTAMALLVAIPAAIAYNRMVAWIEQIEEKLAILQKSLIFTLEHHVQTST